MAAGVQITPAPASGVDAPATSGFKQELLPADANLGQVSKPRVVDLWALAIAVPIKNILSCILLGPVMAGECHHDRFCLPWVNVILLAADVIFFSGHLLLSIQRPHYRERLPTYNLRLLLISWTVWNLFSHPVVRQHIVDLFVAPQEVHVTINIAAILACCSKVMPLTGMQHLTGLISGEFLISLVLSGIEMLNFSFDSGWLSTVRVDIVMFNVAILLIGSTIILGTMTVERDIRTLAHEMESRLGPSGTFEEDLEKRKRAVLTALCDAVLTTNATFQVIGSDDGADRVFRRPMLNEVLTDFLKDQAEREKFWAAVKKQFPGDDSVGEGPKRMRVALRDDNDLPFEADVVVSDASTDMTGKVNKYMVGMHIRGEFRARALEDGKQRQRTIGGEKRHVVCGDCERNKDKRFAAIPGDDQSHQYLYLELSHGLFATFQDMLQPKGGPETYATSAPMDYRDTFLSHTWRAPR